ncbi:MAG: preprotein translocase subunit SecG [Oscillospiraceae bacterium]|nr:preprotein translocase subunit SecG [Oscillospiraceae bacterium]
MQIHEIVLGVLLIIVSITIAALVLLQEGKSQGLSGAIAGGADTFFGKNKGRTIEQLLVRITRIVAIGFFVLVLGTFLLFLFL